LSETYHYHATFASRLGSIRRRGLLPGRRRNWRNHFGAAQGRADRIYLCGTFDAAARWAFKMEYDLERPVVVVRLRNVRGLEPDPHVQSQLNGNGQWFMTGVPVPPEDVVGDWPMTPALGRELVATMRSRTEVPAPDGPQGPSPAP
jgi:hypothetical protein